jgi:hypothetical protein
VFYAAGTTETTATFFADTITGFDPAADIIGFSIDDFDSGTGADANGIRTLSTIAGTDISTVLGVGNAGIVVATIAPNATTTGTTAVFLKFTSITSTSFASAIGANGTIATTTNNWANGEVVLTMWYDATNSRGVLGFLLESSDTGGANTFSANDTFITVTTIGMTTAQYTAFSGASNLLFAA